MFCFFFSFVVVRGEHTHVVLRVINTKWLFPLNCVNNSFLVECNSHLTLIVVVKKTRNWVKVTKRESENDTLFWRRHWCVFVYRIVFCPRKSFEQKSEWKNWSSNECVLYSRAFCYQAKEYSFARTAVNISFIFS